MITTLLLIITTQLTLLLSAQTEPKVVICTVVKVDERVSCPTERGTELFIFTEHAEARDIFDEWRLRAPMQPGGSCPNTDAPLYKVEVKVGDKVKAEIGDNTFREVGECHVRRWRAIKRWRMFREGERTPNSLCWPVEDDCQPDRSKN